VSIAVAIGDVFFSGGFGAVMRHFRSFFGIFRPVLADLQRTEGDRRKGCAPDSAEMPFGAFSGEIFAERCPKAPDLNEVLPPSRLGGTGIAAAVPGTAERLLGRISNRATLGERRPTFFAHAKRVWVMEVLNFYCLESAQRMKRPSE
jgi:hypothetical protein